MCGVITFGISTVVGFFLARSARAETQQGKQRGETLRKWAYALGWIAVGYWGLIIVAVAVAVAVRVTIAIIGAATG